MSRPGLTRVSDQVRTQDGVRIAFDCYTADSRGEVVVLCPGFFKSKETAIFQAMSRRLAQSHDVVCMDFRGHGRSGGRFTFSACEQDDLHAVLEWARARYARMAVVGFSLGGAIAIQTLSSASAKVRSLVAVSVPTSFEEIELRWWRPEAIWNGIQGLGRGAGCRPGHPWRRKERPIERVAALKGLPLLIIHGTRDQIVDVSHSHRLFAAAQEPKRLEIISGGSHADGLFRQHPERFSQLLLDWCAWTLQEA